MEEFKHNVPSLNMLFCKSDNANCYHSTFAAEGLYHLCKQHDIQLLRYDYNEPQVKEKTSVMGKVQQLRLY